MPDPTPLDVVRSRFPSTNEGDASPLREYAEGLNALRSTFRAHDLQGVEMALTFDPVGDDPHD